jgi:hypothetical protein
MEWGQSLQDFEMVWNFVWNTPWQNREEKSTIQAIHKIAWHLECPSSKVDRFYMILKVMKNNKSIFWLLGMALMLARNPGPDALPVLCMHLAGLVHFHIFFQMPINHVALRGLVNPDKEVAILRLEDEDGDPQDKVSITVRQVLFKHTVDGIPLWQNILQNNDGSWHGYYSNGQGCKCHKGVATSWSGYVLGHLKFHLLKRGVTEESTLALIRESFSPQALWEALNTRMKNGWVVSAVQAEMEDKMDDMMKRAYWVDIRMGM